jgi:hypothetical protein
MEGSPPTPSLARRCAAGARWIVPAGILALLPKCPACIVAYLAISSGIGISITTAIYLRMALVMLSVASLCYFAGSYGHGVITWWRSTQRHPQFEASKAVKNCQ